MQNKSLRTFYALTLTQMLSMIGSQMSSFALGIWVFADTGNATPLMLVSLFFFLPGMLGGSMFGVLADRFPRRRLMVLADAGQAVPTFLLFLSFATGAFALWQLYLAVLVQSIFASLQRPALMASITLLIPDSHRERANAIQQAIGPMAGIIAPMIAGLLYAAVSVEGILLIDLATFLVAVAVIGRLSIPQPPVTAEGALHSGSMMRQALGGFRFLRARPMLLLLIVYFSLVNFFAVLPGNLNTPYILSLTDNNESLLGILVATVNLGMVAGSIFIGAWGGTRPRIHTILGGLLLTSLFMMLLGVARQPLLIGIALFGMTFPLPGVNALVISIMQTKVPPDLQGRVFAVIQQLAMFTMPVSLLLAGPLVDKVLEPAVGTAQWERVAPLLGTHAGAGMGLLILGCGVLLLLLTLAIYSVRGIRSLEADMADYLPEALPDTAPDSLEALPAFSGTVEHAALSD